MAHQGRSTDPEFMAPPLQIYVGTTWIKFRCSRSGLMGNRINIAPFIQKYLQNREWVPYLHRYVVVNSFVMYDDDNQMAIFPRYSLDKLLKYLENTRVELIDVPPITPRDNVKMSMKNNFELRPNQVELGAALIDDSISFKPLNAATSAGKTIVTIYGIVTLKYPALLILGELVEQWYRSIRQFTKLSSSEVVVVQGKDALIGLWETLNKGFKPKIVILSLRTALSYIEHHEEYAQLPSFAKFQEVCGFGVKAFDEIHMQFNAKTKVDLCCNIKNNIYLSATYMRTNIVEKRIFDMVFPKDKRIGNGQMHKFTIVYMLEYTLGIYALDAARFKLAKGYNHSVYEKFLLDNRKYFNAFMSSVIIPIVQMYYLNIKKKGQKLLILAQTRDMTIEITKRLIEEFKNTKIEYFFSGSGSKHGKEEIFRKFDIIVSTHKSCGTGRDIKNMKTCINTVSFNSPVLANQVMGRLRQLPGEDTIFIDLWNKDIGSHFFHKNSRMEVYLTKALRYEEHKI